MAKVHQSKIFFASGQAEITSVRGKKRESPKKEKRTVRLTCRPGGVGETQKRTFYTGGGSASAAIGRKRLMLGSSKCVMVSVLISEVRIKWVVRIGGSKPRK